MKSKFFLILSIFIFLGILFCFESCHNFFTLQNGAKTTINISLDLSKIVKNPRNETSQTSEYTLKIFVYDATNFTDGVNVETLPLVTQAKNVVDTTTGEVHISLEVPIDVKVIFVAKLFKDDSQYPLYAGKSDVYIVKPTENKIHINLKSVQTGINLDIDINTDYTVEHYLQNIQDNEYTLTENDTQSFAGSTAGTTVVPKNYTGFTIANITQERNTQDGSTLVKIYYDRNLYTVSFMANGGTSTSIPTQYIRYQGNATLPTTAPTRTGYIFLGWFTLDEGVASLDDNAFNFASEITDNVVLYAKWWDNSSFVYVEGASINGAIKGSGYTTSEIFKEGAIVSIPNFYMCDHEVTQLEYKSIMGTWPDESRNQDDLFGVGDLYPAYYISWFDTLVYCNKRSIEENLTPCYSINGSTNPADWGEMPTISTLTTDPTWINWWNVTCDFQANGYRLPTNAEWEYAARGGNELTGYQYEYAGSDNIDDVAWYASNSEDTVHVVKTKQANDLDLYDMSGNLFEWCWDTVGTDIDRRRRSGSWIRTTLTDNSVSKNHSCYSAGRYSDIGFRLVRTATAQEQGDVYSQGILLNGKIYDKTSEVVVVAKGTVARIAMSDDSSWSSYLEDDVDLWYKGVFLKDRKVQLSPFAMSRFEVTQELYEAVIGSNPSHFQSEVATGETQQLRPVEQITWYDAVYFCNELTKRTMGEEYCVYTIINIERNDSGSIKNANVTFDLSKTGYRLATETEWEFAARGGNPESDVWKYAYAGVSSEDQKYFWRDEITHEVGLKHSNTLGLYDMSSNVLEWTVDGYATDVTANDNGIVINPVGIASDVRHVTRGGACFGELFRCYVSYRHAVYTDNGSSELGIGLRLVRTLE